MEVFRKHGCGKMDNYFHLTELKQCWYGRNQQIVVKAVGKVENVLNAQLFECMHVRRAAMTIYAHDKGGYDRCFIMPRSQQ